MFIFGQDREVITNLKNIGLLGIVKYKEEYCIYTKHNEEQLALLGRYKTMEMAKKVLANIFLNATETDGRGYLMPEDDEED